MKRAARRSKGAEDQRSNGDRALDTAQEEPVKESMCYCERRGGAKEACI